MKPRTNKKYIWLILGLACVILCGGLALYMTSTFPDRTSAIRHYLEKKEEENWEKHNQEAVCIYEESISPQRALNVVTYGEEIHCFLTRKGHLGRFSVEECASFLQAGQGASFALSELGDTGDLRVYLICGTIYEKGVRKVLLEYGNGKKERVEPVFVPVEDKQVFFYLAPQIGDAQLNQVTPVME